MSKVSKRYLKVQEKSRKSKVSKGYLIVQAFQRVPKGSRYPKRYLKVQGIEKVISFILIVHPVSSTT